jgi:hypothetical protein
MRLRYRGCANSLNRSTLQTEKALDLRLGDELPTTSDPMPEQMQTPGPMPTPEPMTDKQEAELKAAIEQALANHRDRAHPATHEERNKQIWASAMIDAMQQLGVAVQPVPHG